MTTYAIEYILGCIAVASGAIIFVIGAMLMGGAK